jgi:tetratricopeptide (TPR) repeat protein
VLAAVVAIVAGCAGPGAVLTPPQDEATSASETTPPRDESTPPRVEATLLRVELIDTPFFPQRDYQCGPAALATVLAASGIAVDADELVPEVFLPGRKGSLQPELVAAARKRGRLPYIISPNPQALVAQLAAGIPVMVLQKLGAGPWPGWHYAVLVGYDTVSDEFLLRSGTDERLEMSARRFLTTWNRADRWALVTLPPGVLPAEADSTRYMEAAAGLEAVGRLDDAERAYEAAARQWPGIALPRLGIANLAYARGDLRAAERGYREAIELEPGNVAARNNRAEVLMKLGCPASARQEIASAQALAAGGPLAAAVSATSVRIAAVPGGDDPDCPAPGPAAHSVP